mmetsp:Transcript_52871/g.67809  ORF Transcript_52871/g.67809 Transcript_52871/m.67809 type:complete len:159 (-) Transcript_52871:189-665(-)|eukprot:CAMPEP_0114352650 /NCGR_PEP_ID=MMETSP0101-20121206/18099_1 /TAXON_ID=38822 ORGANISM="Pteridomonas danica, Strain PT" /NCGR_SAMPLE_ID=MMETSP0101 /ASSEMBLY_ACC=CAM_ASM_000211 /LENGTH=158 /DNA_ID=CAMNT_0001493145 /DNA_START=86 /DNA_END=562 /DNA_ORIENTATION=+
MSTILSGRTKSTLYVGGLDEKVSEELLHAAFIPFGNIQEVHIPRDFKEDGHRGFGFVQYLTEDDAAAAIDNMDGAELEGRVLRVNIAKPMRHKLGATKPVWSHDEWFKTALNEDRELADAVADAKMAHSDNLTDSLDPMEAKLNEAKKAAKQKGLYVE